MVFVVPRWTDTKGVYTYPSSCQEYTNLVCTVRLIRNINIDTGMVDGGYDNMNTDA